MAACLILTVTPLTNPLIVLPILHVFVPHCLISPSCLHPASSSASIGLVATGDDELARGGGEGGDGHDGGNGAGRGGGGGGGGGEGSSEGGEGEEGGFGPVLAWSTAEQVLKEAGVKLPEDMAAYVSENGISQLLLQRFIELQVRRRAVVPGTRRGGWEVPGEDTYGGSFAGGQRTA